VLAGDDFQNPASFTQHLWADTITGQPRYSASEWRLTLILNPLLAVCDPRNLYTLLELFARECVAELAVTRFERVTSGMLSEDDASRHPTRSRHDFVGHCILQHAVLMDSGFVRERVCSDDRFIDLNLFAGQPQSIWLER
jgi:hypothetical protein